MKNSYLTKKSIIERIIVVFSYQLMSNFMEMLMDIIRSMSYYKLQWTIIKLHCSISSSKKLLNYQENYAEEL